MKLLGYFNVVANQSGGVSEDVEPKWINDLEGKNGSQISYEYVDVVLLYCMTAERERGTWLGVLGFGV